MTQREHGVSRRGFMKTAGSAAALSAIGLSTVASQTGSGQTLTGQPVDGMRFTFGDATPNTSSQYLVIGRLTDENHRTISDSAFQLFAEREVDANGIETISDSSTLYSVINNSEGARYIELCYVVYYSVLEEVTTSDGTGRTFFTKKTYQTQGMVPMTIDLTAPRPDDNVFVFTYSNDANVPGSSGTSPHP